MAATRPVTRGEAAAAAAGPAAPQPRRGVDGRVANLVSPLFRCLVRENYDPNIWSVIGDFLGKEAAGASTLLASLRFRDRRMDEAYKKILPTLSGETLAFVLNIAAQSGDAECVAAVLAQPNALAQPTMLDRSMSRDDFHQALFSALANRHEAAAIAFLESSYLARKFPIDLLPQELGGILLEAARQRCSLVVQAVLRFPQRQRIPTHSLEKSIENAGALGDEATLQVLLNHCLPLIRNRPRRFPVGSLGLAIGAAARNGQSATVRMLLETCLADIDRAAVEKAAEAAIERGDCTIAEEIRERLRALSEKKE